MCTIKPFALTPLALTNSIGIGAAYQDEAGYNLTTYGPFETWDNAMEFCAHVNAMLGMSQREADSIIASSMRAQNERAPQPKEWRITASQTISRDYVVTAETEAQARDIWTATLTPDDAEQAYHEPERIENIENIEEDETT